MLKEVEIFVVLMFLLIAILLIFNARYLVRSKMDTSNENTKVTVIKVFGAVLVALSLIVLYYIK